MATEPNPIRRGSFAKHSEQFPSDPPEALADLNKTARLINHGELCNCPDGEWLSERDCAEAQLSAWGTMLLEDLEAERFLPRTAAKFRIALSQWQRAVGLRNRVSVDG